VNFDEFGYGSLNSKGLRGGAADYGRKVDKAKTHIAGTGEFFHDFEDENNLVANRTAPAPGAVPAGGAKAEVGRVLPAGHKNNMSNNEGDDSSTSSSDDENDNNNNNSDDMLNNSLESLDSSVDSDDFVHNGDLAPKNNINSNSDKPTTPVAPVHPAPPNNDDEQQQQRPQHPKTPKGVQRVKEKRANEIDTTTSDIFSPHNLSQGACLEKFGYAPGEIVNKLFSEHVINEHEDRMIRYDCDELFEHPQGQPHVIFEHPVGATKWNFRFLGSLQNTVISSQKRRHTVLFFGHCVGASVTIVTKPARSACGIDERRYGRSKFAK